MTAAALLSVLTVEGVCPSADGSALVLDADPPARLGPYLRLLHTGARALVTSRIWYGCDAKTGRTVVLNPAESIPHAITLLSVESDRVWDRIHPTARLDLPAAFATVRMPVGRNEGDRMTLLAAAAERNV